MAATVRATTVKATTGKATTGKAMTARVAIVRVASVKAAAKSSRGSVSRSGRRTARPARRGYGFLRINGYLPSRDDVYVSVKQARQFGLCKGDHLTGASRPAGRNERNPLCSASTR